MAMPVCDAEKVLKPPVLDMDMPVPDIPVLPCKLPRLWLAPNEEDALDDGEDKPVARRRFSRCSIVASVSRFCMCCLRIFFALNSMSWMKSCRSSDPALALFFFCERARLPPRRPAAFPEVLLNIFPPTVSARRWVSACPVAWNVG
jgi:hypothetical protein